jgi:hypothetical protein
VSSLFKMGRTAIVAAWLVVAVPTPSVSGDAASTPSARLTSEEAADLAAKLASDECERHYGRRPFSSPQYPIDSSVIGSHGGGSTPAGTAGSRPKFRSVRRAVIRGSSATGAPT